VKNYGRCGIQSIAPSGHFLTGNLTEKVTPPRGFGFREILPPCASTIFFTESIEPPFKEDIEVTSKPLPALNAKGKIGSNDCR
jgi:hypothetical protein